MRTTYEMPRRPDHRERLTPAQVARRWGHSSLELVLRSVGSGGDFAVLEKGTGVVPCTLVLEYELEAGDA